MRIIKRFNIISMIILICLTGCGKSEESSLKNDGTTAENLSEQESTVQNSNISQDENITTNEVTIIDSGTVNNYGYIIPELGISAKDIPETEALDFAQDMKIGWNLGNTFDASVEMPWFEGELEYESAWCGIKTTPEMIKAVKDAGFNTIRIPVSWHNHVNYDYQNFIISEEWLNRVKEVVDYAIDLDMYVIINTHHDIMPGNMEGIQSECFIYPTEECYDTSERYITAIWQQLCETFKDYDEKLIFESMNEPRLTYTNYEWWLDPNSEECKEAVDCINRLNQCFVNVVRDSGGNNVDRYLLIPGYCSSFDGAMNEGFALPEDSSTDKLMVVVHAYTPYNFALQAQTDSGSKNTFDINNTQDTQEIDYIMNALYEKYIINGIPVIIDEFGARNKKTDEGTDNVQARINFAAYYVAVARANGISCCWWDNNSFNSEGEDFGLLNRAGLIWQYADIVQAMMKY